MNITQLYETNVQIVIGNDYVNSSLGITWTHDNRTLTDIKCWRWPKYGWNAYSKRITDLAIKSIYEIKL